jgi:hypothetical protein
MWSFSSKQCFLYMDVKVKFSLFYYVFGQSEIIDRADKHAKYKFI